jgi:hypothetical protein
VKDFNDCHCVLGYAAEYSVDTGSVSCRESDEEQYRCPDNSYLKPGAFPPQAFLDCACDYGFVREDDRCVDRAIIGTPSGAHKCPPKSYIASDRWPTEDFTDCACLWGYMALEEQCTLPPDTNEPGTAAAEEFVTVEFTEDVSCGQVLSEAQSLVNAIYEAVLTASAVFISSSSCEPMDASSTRRLSETVNFVTVVVVEAGEAADSAPLADAVGTSLVNSGFQMSNVAIEEPPPSDGKDSTPTNLVVGAVVGAVVGVGSIVGVAYMLQRRRGFHSEETARPRATKGELSRTAKDTELSNSQIEMKTNPVYSGGAPRV